MMLKDVSPGIAANAHAVWVNNWGMGAGINFNQLTFDDRLTRGGPGGLSEGFRGAWSCSAARR